MIKFISEGVIVDDERTIDVEVVNTDSLKENLSETKANVQKNDRNSDSISKNYESCCKHFF